jgi:HPt (histidine-containing phosphotransfer) domain-containing protein
MALVVVDHELFAELGSWLRSLGHEVLLRPGERESTERAARNAEVALLARHGRVAFMLDGVAIDELEAALAALAPLPALAASSSDPSFLQELEQIRDEYLAALTETCESVRDHLEHDHGVSRHHAHKIRGTAGTYGLADVSLYAGVIDDALEASDLPRARQAAATLVVLAHIRTAVAKRAR